MSDNRITRRHFFYGALLAGAIPAGGFGRVPSLKFLGYQSPNEKASTRGGLSLTLGEKQWVAPPGVFLP